MKFIFPILIITLLSVGCSVKTERLRYAIDNCYFCKMTLADDKFGGELVTKKGKVFKFDDVKCMVSFLNSSEGIKNEYEYELVADYDHKADEFDLITAEDAFYLKSENLKSPMGGNIAAFKNEEACKEYAKTKSGSIISWSEVKNMFK